MPDGFTEMASTRESVQAVRTARSGSEFLPACNSGNGEQLI